jgi:hypothetical protein
MIEAILYTIAKVASLALGAVSWMMLIRVMLELVGRVTTYDISENKIYIFSYAVSEAFVAPFRYLCVKLNVFQGTPIDVPFFMAMLTIMILQNLFPLI